MLDPPTPREGIAALASNIKSEVLDPKSPTDSQVQAVKAALNPLPSSSGAEGKQTDYFENAVSTTATAVNGRDAESSGHGPNAGEPPLSDKSTAMLRHPANVFAGTTNISGNSRSHLGNVINNFQHTNPSEPSPENISSAMRALGQHHPEDDRKVLDRERKTTNGTSQWVLELPMFKKWRSEENPEHPLIWIRDMGEMGKTKLTIVLTKHLEKTRLKNDDFWVLYYFCDRRHKDRNSAILLIRGFIWQLLKLSELQGDLAALYYNEFCIQEPQYFLSSLEALWKIFCQMIDACPVRRIFCIVDGLEQCYDETTDGLDRTRSFQTLDHFLENVNDLYMERTSREASKMPETLRSESSGPPPQTNIKSAMVCDIRMIILSRETPSCIVERLSPHPNILLKRGAHQNVEDDFQRIVVDNVRKASTSCERSNKSSKETTDIISKILNGGESRSLLWVSLMAEKLTSMEQASIKKYSRQIPSSVEAMDVQTLLEIPSRQRLRISAILKWVALAARPLSTLGLMKAVKYYLKASISKKKLRQSLKLCHPIICEQEDDKGKMVVMLAHQSALELLIGQESPLRREPRLKDFVFDRSNAHSELANTCIAYLQKSAHFETSRRVRLKDADELKTKNAKFFTKHPFLEYAIAHWTFHAKHGKLEKTHYGAKFFENDSIRRKLWWESYFISLRHSFAWKWTTPGQFSLLHLAAFFDIIPLAQFVHERGLIPKLLSAEDHQGMKPINWATERSQAAMVSFLLLHGDFDSGALLQAARTGDATIIKMLLENRKKMRRSPGIGSISSSPAFVTSPVQSFRKVTLNSISEWAKRLDGGNEESLTPLSPEAGGYGKLKTETALHIAATCGHDQAVQALLDAGEEIHSVTNGGWTALHNAAWFGRASVVNLLIAAGANPMSRTKEQLTPLHCAVRNSQPDVVACLLSKHVPAMDADGEPTVEVRSDTSRAVDIEAEDQFGFTAFHMACHTSNVKMIEILFSFGANIEKRTKQGWTPLLWACINGNYAIVESLLNLGVNVDARWNGRQFGEAEDIGPVGLAKAYRHEEIAHLVKNHGGIDTNRLTLDEAEALPQAEMAQGSYDVPVVEDIFAVGRHDTDTSLDVDDLESSTDSDDESNSGESDEDCSNDDDSVDAHDISDDGSRPRKQSVGSNPSKRRQSSHSLLGLGIHEEISDCVQKDEMRNDTVRATETHMALSDRLNGAQHSGSTRVDVEECESPEPLEGINRTLSLNEATTEAVDTSTNTETADKRAISTPEIPGFFKDQFGRLALRRGSKKASSITSEEHSTCTDATKDYQDPLTESSQTVGNEAGSAVTSPNKGVGLLGRLSSFGRRSESGGQNAMAAALAYEDLGDATSKTGNTATSNEASLPEDNDEQNLSDNAMCSNYVGSPEVTGGSKSPGFSTKRLFRRKTSSSSKYVMTTVPEDALKPVVTDKKDDSAQAVGSLNDELANYDSEKAAHEDGSPFKLPKL